MVAANFPACLALVFASEGGFVNNPKDPGGATNMGITISTLRAWRGRPVTVDDVRNLTKDEAGKIYRANYWARIIGDQLPAGVDYATFDLAVNSGPSLASRFLQNCLYVREDGIIGPITLKAATQTNPLDLINALCDKRLNYLRGLDTWPTFGNEWTNRVASVRKAALKMAGPIPAFFPSEMPLPPPPDVEPVVPPPPLSMFEKFVIWLRGVFTQG